MDEMENQMEELLFMMGNLIADPSGDSDTESESDSDVSYLYRAEPGRDHNALGKHPSGISLTRLQLRSSNFPDVTESTGPRIHGTKLLHEDSESRSTTAFEPERSRECEERWVSHGEERAGPGISLPFPSDAPPRRRFTEPGNELSSSSSDSFQSRALKEPRQAKDVYGLTRKRRVHHVAAEFADVESLASSGTQSPDQRLPIEESTGSCGNADEPKAKKNRGPHHVLGVLRRSPAVSPEVFDSKPQPSSNACHQLSPGSSQSGVSSPYPGYQSPAARPRKQMGSFLRAGSGTSLLNSSNGAPRQAWGSLPTALERGLPSNAPRVFPLTSPLLGSMNQNLKLGTDVMSDVDEATLK